MSLFVSLLYACSVSIPSLEKEEKKEEGNSPQSQSPPAGDAMNEQNPTAQARYPELEYQLPEGLEAGQIRMFETSKSIYVQFRSASSFDNALFVNPIAIDFTANCSGGSKEETSIESQKDLTAFLEPKGEMGVSKVGAIKDSSIAFAPELEENNIFITSMKFLVKPDHVSLKGLSFVDGCAPK